MKALTTAGEGQVAYTSIVAAGYLSQVKECGVSIIRAVDLEFLLGNLYSTQLELEQARSDQKLLASEYARLRNQLDRAAVATVQGIARENALKDEVSKLKTQVAGLLECKDRRTKPKKKKAGNK